jgi:hypothetical protein
MVCTTIEEEEEEAESDFSSYEFIFLFHELAAG